MCLFDDAFDNTFCHVNFHNFFSPKRRIQKDYKNSVPEILLLINIFFSKSACQLRYRYEHMLYGTARGVPVPYKIY